jgi:hypothetical protein
MQESSLKVRKTLEDTARELAQANAKAEPTILRIYWFPHSDQIRLVEIDEEALRDDDETIHPFYFRPTEDVPFTSGIALLPPSEEKKKLVPQDWGGDWSSGEVVFNRNGN